MLDLQTKDGEVWCFKWAAGRGLRKQEMQVVLERW